MALKQQVAFIKELYGFRLKTIRAGYLQRHPVALLQLEPGRRDPYPLYEKIRAHGPLMPTPMEGLATVDHALCDEVLRSRDFLTGADGEDRGLSIVEMNPPDHTRLRRLVAPYFTRAKIAAFEPRIQTILDELIKKVPRDEPFDLMSSLAAPLPIAVITDLLGIPDANADEFARHGAEFGSALGGVRSIAHAKRLAATRARLAEIFAEVFELRSREPSDDVIGQIVASGDAIRPAEMVPLCTLLLIAGFETTVNLIGNTVLALLSNPDQWRLLTQSPDLADRAIEEGLRYDPPVQRTARVAARATELAGREIPAGEWVLTAIAGANRDPGVFDQPDRFDITRPNADDHLSFSGGIHYCLGAGLARLEATVALRAIVTEFGDLEFAGRQERRAGSLIRGMQHLPLRTRTRRLTPIS